MTSKPPDLYVHLDYRLYLRSWFAWKQSNNNNYSYRVFASKSKLAASTLKNIIEGKRHASDESITGFAKAIGWDEDQKRYFQLLVELAKEPGVRRRGEILDTIFGHEGYRWARPISELHRQYLSKWYYVTIREMTLLSDFRADPEWIAQRLGGRITAEQARQAVNDLQLAGLLILKNETLVPAEVRLDTPPEVDEPFRENHEAMMLQAIESLSAVHWEHRYIGAATLVVSERQLALLRNEAKAFIRSVMNMVDAEDEPRTRVVQLNVQLFPHTDPPGSD